MQVRSRIDEFRAPRTANESRSQGNADTQLRRRVAQNQSGGPRTNPTSTPSQGPVPRTPAINVNGAPVLGSSPFVATPPQPRRRVWLDRVADALLGEEMSSPGLDPARSKYALVCERCSTHNGLVMESLWEDTRMCSSSVVSYSINA